MKIFVYIFVISVISLGIRYMLKLIFPYFNISENQYPDFSLNCDCSAELQDNENIGSTSDSL
jgi:hypothetical protein